MSTLLPSNRIQVRWTKSDSVLLTVRHALILEHALRPLFGFFQALVAPVGIYLSAGDFDGTTILNPEVFERVELAVDDVVPLMAALVAGRREPARTRPSTTTPTTAARLRARE
jgi:NAD(P)H-dependent FMN reductase